jgi:HAD superfamily hydrolase (TIGR01484 family)
MIKLFVFDMDGTALPYGADRLSDGVLFALDALADSGVCLAVASGRSPESLTRLLSPLKNPVYVIGHDGAIARQDGRVVYRRPIPAESVRAFCRHPKNEGRTLLLYGEDTVYLRTGSGDEAAIADAEVPTVKIKNEYAVREPIYKVAAYGGAPMGATDPALRPTYRTDAAEEYVCAYTNKGVALSDLQTRLPVSVFDTVAAGDGRADLPLFARAALTFAPDGAPEEIKSAAEITGSFADFLSVLAKATQNRP